VAERILSASGSPTSELAVTVVGDREIRRLNRDYLGRDKVTNVISFPMNEGEFAGIHAGLLGDVVICAGTAEREAEAAGMRFWERLCALLLHGILHLTGYDHERSGEEEAARMEARERELMALLEKEGYLE
jgi:probable rRNA maturation factor